MAIVLAVLNDMIFESRIAAVAAALGIELVIARDAAAALLRLDGVGGVLLDLNLDGGTTSQLVGNLRSRRPGLAIVGFLSHVQKDLAREAAAVGVDPVLPRSRFVEDLPELLRRLSGASPSDTDQPPTS
ncbi:MAG: response regulator [Deltaproteobacteria bacterium]|nr:response regulator [Deltaproteobacteria bacterium]